MVREKNGKRVNRFVFASCILAIGAITISGCGGRNYEEIETNAGLEAYTEVASSEEQTEEPTFFVNPRVEEPVVNPVDEYPYDWEHGTCKRISDKTLIVSIFLDDINYAWDLDNPDDTMIIDNQLDNIRIATDWICENVAEYGVSAEFIYDWNENPDLFYTAAVEKDVCNTEDNVLVWEAIDSAVDTAALIKKYNTPNILYMIIQNTPANWDLTSLTWLYENDDYPYEYCMMHPYYKGGKSGPNSYAHEILHAFGAHDLYMYGENETYVATKEYVDYLKSTGSKDIMFSVYNQNGREEADRVTGTLSEVDAYYIGICDKPDQINEYGLDESEYE